MQGRPISGFLRELSLPASTLKFFAAARGLRPCRGHAWRAFLLPFGAPGDGPPRIRPRPFGIAGARHEVPPRVRPPQRGVGCMDDLLGTC
jgi:hypothetical protein